MSGLDTGGTPTTHPADLAPGRDTLRPSFATVAPDRIREAIGILAELVAGAVAAG